MLAVLDSDTLLGVLLLGLVLACVAEGILMLANRWKPVEAQMIDNNQPISLERDSRLRSDCERLTEISKKLSNAIYDTGTRKNADRGDRDPEKGPGRPRCDERSKG